MNLLFTNQTSKREVFQKVKTFLLEKGFNIIKIDQERPWGGFFVIDESQSSKFKHYFFNETGEDNEERKGKQSPKILIVERDKRLSWQYHHRRSEIWKVIGGEIGVKRSNTDVEGPIETKKINTLISLHQGERHRLIGLDSWGIVAEIWQHTDPDHPSDEEDIVRVQDDFGR
ncbi:phosphoheptose isomerase [Ginsengibacter hankyongi]|uniref:Phosphoheptose isomerase n=1 Tax=Ginsengibacter hankyongi TaxID=2607284 RepID=A0A5J5IMQ9_9BACT|nr:phosphoheptose isomerase [Ginsengibacter hankyongi]KAA9041981.1 phosphoheptose isomerase [Ginsengibacter hankyongi]